jgi:succinate-acetate transporter protein
VYGGYVGVATAFCAWYTSAAGIINTTFGKTVLPLGPAKR